MIYLEFISRRPHVDVQTFRRVMAALVPVWSDLYPEDECLGMLGRTFRLGPEPEYMTLWRAEFNRIDAWKRIFAQDVRLESGHAVGAVSRIDVAGVYDELIPGVPLPASGPYYAEYFKTPGSLSDDDMRQAYADAQRSFPRLKLHLLLLRVGQLAPDPGGIAFWSAPDFEALEPMARRANSTGPIEITTVGTYERLGDEVL